MTDEEIHNEARVLVGLLKLSDKPVADAAAVLRDIASRARSEALDEAAEEVKGFDGWVWCECSECGVDASSHAVNTDDSLQALASAVRARKGEGEDESGQGAAFPSR